MVHLWSKMIDFNSICLFLSLLVNFTALYLALAISGTTIYNTFFKPQAIFTVFMDFCQWNVNLGFLPEFVTLRELKNPLFWLYNIEKVSNWCWPASALSQSNLRFINIGQPEAEVKALIWKPTLAIVVIVVS